MGHDFWLAIFFYIACPFSGAWKRKYLAETNKRTILSTKAVWIWRLELVAHVPVWSYLWGKFSFRIRCILANFFPHFGGWERQIQESVWLWCLRGTKQPWKSGRHVKKWGFLFWMMINLVVPLNQSIKKWDLDFEGIANPELARIPLTISQSPWQVLCHCHAWCCYYWIVSDEFGIRMVILPRSPQPNKKELILDTRGGWYHYLVSSYLQESSHQTNHLPTSHPYRLGHCEECQMDLW